ncbi:hypothetical protein ACFLZI_02670 [Nitrospirota bacterium]
MKRSQPYIVIFLLALAVILTAGPASAQTHTQEAGILNTPADETAFLNTPQEAIPYKPFIRALSGRVSVVVINAPFGEVIKEVADQAGFEALVSKDIASKELTTSFRDMDLERGIQRLLTLINHRNYFIFYDEENSIKKIEIYGAVQSPKPVTPARDNRPSMRPGVQRVPTYQPEPVPRPSSPARRTGISPGRTVHKPRAEQLPVEPNTPGVKYDDSSDIPYLAPVREPSYIPPPRRR